MATNPYSYGSLGQRWTVGEPTSKSLLDVSRVKADANRWALEQLVVDPDDTANFVLTAPGLNIDSNTLYVDSVNNSVGFGLTNPNDYAFNGTPSWVASGGAGNASVIVVSGTTSIGYLAFADGTTGTDRYSGNIQYNHSTNTMSFRTNGGVEAMTVNSAQDFAVDTDTLFVDASADRVGIGTTSPDQLLHLKSDTPQSILLERTTAQDQYINYKNTNRTWSAGLDEGIGWVIAENASISSTQRFVVEQGGSVGINTSSPSSYFSTDLVVKASANGGGVTIAANGTTDYNNIFFARGTSGNDRFRGQIQYLHSVDRMNFVTNTQTAMAIDSSQRVGIGTISPTTKLHVSGASSASALRLDETTSSANSYLGYIDTSGNFGIDVNGGGYLRFAVGGAERARILSSGGITFNGDTSSNNALSDYEQGVWSPTIDGFTGTYGQNSGTYVKIGQLVHASCYITLSSITSMDGTQLDVSGFPFAAENSTSVFYAGNFGNFGFLDLPTGTVDVAWNIGNGLTYSTCRAMKDNADYENVLNTAITSTSFFMYVSWTYRTA